MTATKTKLTNIEKAGCQKKGLPRVCVEEIPAFPFLPTATEKTLGKVRKRNEKIISIDSDSASFPGNTKQNKTN
jgi:hypothetical protein